jgi:hypothetical protein
LERQTCRRNRTPAQGSAAWTGSYWTAASPTCLKRSTHLITFLNRSLKITVSPPFRVYRHPLFTQSCIDCSVSSWSSDKILSLSGQLKLILLRSSSLRLAAARAQRSLLHRAVRNWSRQFPGVWIEFTCSASASLLQSLWKRDDNYFRVLSQYNLHQMPENTITSNVCRYKWLKDRLDASITAQLAKQANK